LESDNETFHFHFLINATHLNPIILQIWIISLQGTGTSGLSTTAFWGIIGGVAAFVIIVIVVIVVIVCRKKYSAVSQNP
jgi:hypothetical protein